MAAKVIHFKKNGSSAPQKFVADDGGNNISAFLSSPRGAETIFLPFSACSAPANTFPNGFGFCRPTASVQKCGENRAEMAAGLMQKGK